MNTRHRKSTACKVSTVIAACALGLPAGLFAGEAIQFSNARNRQDPTAKSKLPTGIDEGGFGRMNPLDYVPPGAAPGLRRDPSKDRKVRNAAAERANWMVLERGELDKRDEDKRAFGVREVTIEKESERKDYFFTPVDDKDTEDKPGKSRTVPGRPSGSGRPDQPEDSGELAPGGIKPEENPDNRRNQVLGKDGQPLGEHASKDLDLKDLLNSGKANSLAPSDRSANLWKDVVGAPASDSGHRRDEPSTADTFRGAVASGPAARPDPFNFRSDPAPRSSGPAFSGLATPSSRSFSATAPPVAPRAADPGFGLGREPSLFNSPQSPAAGNSFVSPGAAGGQDPFNRPARSSSSYQIPSRPGGH